MLQLLRAFVQLVFLPALILAAGVHMLGGVGPSRAQPAPVPAGGCLGFHQVHPEVSAPGALQTRVPEGFQIYLVAYSDRPAEGLVLRETPFAEGGDLADAEAIADPATGQPILILRFSETGRAKLAGFTKANVGRPIAIVVDGRVISAPMLREPLLDGVGRISGSLSLGDAAELVRKLKARTCSAGGQSRPR